MSRQYFITGMIFLTSCSNLLNPKTSSEIMDSLKSAIERDDSAILKEYLSPKYKDTYLGSLTPYEPSFAEKALESGPGMKSYPDGGLGHHLLGEATYASSGSYRCSPKSVKALLDLGVAPTEVLEQGRSKIPVGHLSGAILSYCPETILLLINRLPKKYSYQSVLKFTIKDELKNDATMAGRIGSTIKIIKEFLDPDCKLKSIEACNGIAHIKKEMNDFANREKAEEFAATPAGQLQKLKNQSCDLLVKIETQNKIIARERRIGKTSGYVNPNILHSSGRQIEYLKSELSKVNAELAKRGEGPVPRLNCVINQDS